MTEEVKVWSIGESSELYAAHSEEEVKRYYTELVGEEDAAEGLKCHFELVAEGDGLDDEHEYDDEGVKKTLSFHQLIAMNGPVPTQISTSYN
jgi:hypothetical protein